MSPTLAGAGSVAVEEAFAALVCDDPELLDAEFEAIMTASGFLAGPPAPSGPPQGRAAPRDGARREAHSVESRPSKAAVVVRMHRRQRSPPRFP